VDQGVKPHGKAAPYRTGEYALTRKEYDKALAACQNLEDRVLIMVGCSIGLRRDDIIRLEWGNIDIRDPENATVTYQEKKKGNRIRTVPIGPKLAQELTILRNTQPKTQKTVFSFKGRQAYNRFQKVCRIAGIEGRPFHALRATAIKFMQAARWSPEQISEITGDTIRTIQEHYVTPSKSELAESAREREVV
jgi:integrase